MRPFLADAFEHHVWATLGLIDACGELPPDQLAAPLGIRLAQVLHHGPDHRSQACAGTTLVGFEPPAIDAWDYADQQARLREVPAPPGSAS